MKASITCRDAQQAHKVLNAVLWPQVKSWLLCGGGALVVSVKPEARTLQQNAIFHAICEDLARSELQWLGKRRDAAAWKVLLVSGHAVATKADCEIVPGLEGEFVALRESTAQMDKARSSSLVDYSLAFCAMQGVAVQGRPE